MTESTRPTVQANASAAGAPLSVVGLGASAGGLAALSTFFDTIPSDTGMTFVVVTHLSPDHESILAELLQSHTTMPVSQVVGRVKMQRNHVYVIPPGKRLVVTEGHLALAELNMPRGRRLQIDIFFRSLAEHYGDGAAIILSGTGSDGAVGLQSIKERGGLILVQEPTEAEFDDMPQSAIATGLVDIVAPVAELAMQLVAAKQTRARLALPEDPAALSPTADATLAQLLDHLREATGHTFGGYRRGPILQRLGRRMQLVGVETLSGYLQRLRSDPQETHALYLDLVTHVTEFFRNPTAWEQLAQTVIPELFRGKGRDDQVRVWTVGCANGEEAYGIGMLLLEHAATLDNPPQIQIFASDLGRSVLDFARAGLYPAAIAADVGEERLARFFTPEESRYRVTRALRNLVLFVPHNLLQDPPFARLDLIICRNLLSKLAHPAQEQVYTAFHYALRQNITARGYLFLGTDDLGADSSTQETENETGQEIYNTLFSGDRALFEVVDATHQIYRRTSWEPTPGTLSGRAFPSAQPDRVVQKGVEMQHPMPDTADGTADNETTHRLLLEEMAPPSLLVDEEYNLLHMSETAGRFLQIPGGPLTTNVTQLVRIELRKGLRTVLTRALKSGRGGYAPPVPVQFDDAVQPVALFVQPSPQQGHVLVVFLAGEATALVDASAATLPVAETATATTVLHLRHQVETLDQAHAATLEELRNANAELQSANEEYHALNVELESSKAELQSANEELLTLNEELRLKIAESNTAHNDLQTFFAATEIAALFLDRGLRVGRYTPRATDLFNLRPADRGRPITHLKLNFDCVTLEADARRVLATLLPSAQDVQGDDGRWYLLHIRPYRTVADHIEGVIITLVDVTNNKQNELALRNAKEYAESIIQTIPDALLVLNSDLRVQSANDTFYTMFAADRATTEGQLVYELGNGQWDIPQLRTLLEETLPDNQIFTGYEVTHEFEGIGRRTMLLNGRQLERTQAILLAITDITARKQAEEALQQSEERYRLLVESAQEYAMFMLDPGGLITAWNTGAERIFGYSEAEAIGLDGALIFTEEDRAAGVPAAEQETARRTGQAADDRWHRRKDGSHFWANGVTEVLRHPDGTLSGFAKVLRDNTKQKQAEEALRDSEWRYQQALRAGRFGTWTYEYATDTNYFDARSQAIFGFDRAYFTSAEVDRVIHPDDYVDFVKARKLARDPMGYGTFDMTHRIIHPDGAVRWVRANCRVFFGGVGSERRAVRGVGVIADVTEQKKAEDALRSSEERFRALVDASAQIVWTTDSTGRAIEDSPSWRAVTGQTYEEYVGWGWVDAVHPADQANTVEAWQHAVETSTPYRIECRIYSAAGGNYRWNHIRAVPLKNADGTIRGWVGMNNDIHQRKEAEAALRALNESLEARVAERTQQVRELVMELSMSERAERHRISQILHDDLQQRLYSLQFQLMLLRDLLGDTANERAEASSTETASGTEPSTLLDSITDMEQDVQNAISITRSLSVDLSPPVLEGEGLVEAIEWLATQMREKQGLAVHVHGVERLPVPNTNLRVLLFQAVREALFNIVKHAGVTEADVQLSHPDKQLCIEVIDRGTGFDVDAMLRDPQNSHGLWQNRRRLELVGGHMAIQSSPETGTHVILSCPFVPEEKEYRS